MAVPALVALVVPLCAATTAAADDLTTDEKLAFLRQARIVASRAIGKGTTGALRLTLTDGTITHDAAFQRVNLSPRSSQARPTGEPAFVDAFRYNIAAWELARLLGLDGMTPPTVARTVRGQPGALSWWIDDVLMDEAERERTDTTPPNGLALELSRQRQRMLVFGELVHDTDRNKGNVLYTTDWRLVMLDFTRAFRTTPVLRAPAVLTAIDCDLLERLRALDRAAVRRAVGPHLTVYEADAILKRRDLIVSRFDRLLATRGTAGILF